MSELIAEARVLVTPDTAAFRTALTAQLAAATKGVVVPVQVAPVVTSAAGTAALAAQEAQIAASATRTADAVRGATDAKNAALATNRAYARSLSGVTSGAASAGLSLVGLRGATLAATGPFLAGAAGAIALGKAIGIATSFNSQIAVLGATTGATGEQLEQAAAAARSFGRDITLPGVTAGDAAETITEFSKAGLDLNDSIAATRGGLQLAQAAQLSYADAVELTANALNAFNLEGDQAIRVADTLANAANLAQGGIGDTALALRQAAGAAAVVGVSFEDTAALLTLLARNGLTGSDAGTALRTAFIRLVNPSKQAQKILADLNVDLRDLNGNVRPEVFAEFAAAQADLSQKTQQANAAIVFGQDAFRAFGFLGREGKEGLDEVRVGLDQTGTAARIAGARMTGLAGAQENLSNQLSTLGETVGQVATGPLTTFVNKIAEFVAIGTDAVTTAGAIGGAFKNLGSDIAGSIPGGGFLVDAFAFTNPITGIGNPVRQVAELGDLFGLTSKDTADEIRKSGADVRSGIEDAGREAARGAVSFGEQITGAVDAAFSAARGAFEQQAREFRQAQLGAVGRGRGQAAGLEELFDQILASGGGDRAQIAGLQRQARVQAQIIADAGPNAAGVLLEARRTAQAKLASINQQITAIEERIASEQKAANDEQRRIREDAKRERDRAFLQAQEDARTAAERRVTLAEDTPQLADDIRRQEQVRALIQRQIAAVKASALDEQARQSALRALRAARDQTADAIRDLRRANRELREQQRQEALDQRAENLSLRTQIAEARGDEDAVLVALNNEIANQRKRVAAAKKARQGVLEEQLALEQLLRQRRELQDNLDDEDTTGGTTLADLFRRAEEIASGAGNVGFTTTGLRGISAGGRIRAEVQERLDIVGDPVKAAAAQQERSTQSLIQAIDRLTAVLTGNTASGTPITRREQNQWRNLSQEQRFFFQKQAKMMVEQGLVG